ncbi:transmembrane protein, putative (macronuclear) [Tetrahymena thermophila SB210]|uniref:Transmembrane protein, putative n=1 Tax=Tetrahymena thermophila (strain SB210) TaxID=312017 RepID=W7XE63_TETTS|nr:transmembrane protein, putative [Tetrahymena thermophila SB210]EWS71159.1 transmembrane protein, putative [Tetrahymena thermophila SB210]|eukprot:XP_012656300.1 transmembrane protein, putative [Tetrahymena thermophila SB210]
MSLFINGKQKQISLLIYTSLLLFQFQQISMKHYVTLNNLKNTLFLIQSMIKQSASTEMKNSVTRYSNCDFFHFLSKQTSLIESKKTMNQIYQFNSHYYIIMFYKIFFYLFILLTQLLNFIMY